MRETQNAPISRVNAMDKNDLSGDTPERRSESRAVDEHLEVDDTIEMTYYLTDSQGAHENLKTQIKHITKNESGKFQGHYMVGLELL